MGDLALPAGMEFIELPFVGNHQLECRAVSIYKKPVVCLQIDGFRVGFYLNLNDKDVNWRPIIGGIGADLSFNEGNHLEIKNYYYSQRLRKAAVFLNTCVGDLRANENLPIFDDNDPSFLRTIVYNDRVCALTAAERKCVHIPLGFFTRLATRFDMAAANMRLMNFVMRIRGDGGDSDKEHEHRLIQEVLENRDQVLSDMTTLGFAVTFESDKITVPPLSDLENPPNLAEIANEQRNVELAAKADAWSVIKRCRTRSIMLKGETRDSAMVCFTVNERDPKRNRLLHALCRLGLNHEVGYSCSRGENLRDAIIIQGKAAYAIIDYYRSLSGNPVVNHRMSGIRAVPG